MIDPSSNKTEGYHLLLEPKGEARERLSTVIATLAAQYGGPVFVPHVTLLAAIPESSEEEFIAKTKELACTLTPFTCTLEGFGAQDSFFRALYMRVRNSEEISLRHRQAGELFGMRQNQYLPHLSLLYGNYAQDQKLQTIDSLQYLNGTSFEVESVHLYSTPGDTSTWKQVGAYPLTG
ncbi:MAG: 2'-5' RNA ligase family protein [Patescibacteria group bacterium]